MIIQTTTVQHARRHNTILVSRPPPIVSPLRARRTCGMPTARFRKHTWVRGRVRPTPRPQRRVSRDTDAGLRHGTHAYDCTPCCAPEASPLTISTTMGLHAHNLLCHNNNIYDNDCNNCSIQCCPLKSNEDLCAHPCYPSVTIER